MQRRRLLVAGAIVVLAIIAGVSLYLTVGRPRALVFAVVPETTSDVFYDAVRVGCVDEARRLGRAACEFVGPESRDSAAQVRVVEELIGRRRPPDGLAVSPVTARALVPVLQRATAAGIPVITLGRDVPPESGRLAFVGTDNESVGIELARQVITHLPGGATYAILTGDPGDADLRRRVEGVRKQFGGKGPYALGRGRYIEVPGSPFSTGGNTDRALGVVSQVLSSHPTVSALVIVGPWPLLDPDGFRRTIAPKAVQLRNGTFAVVAYNLFEPELQLLKEGLVTGLIGPRPDFMGRESMKLLYDVVVKKTKPTRVLYHSGIRIVTKENVDLFLR